MKKTASGFGVACWCAALVFPSIACAESLNAKPGAWEMTITTTTTGTVIPTEALEKMQPERRAMVEKMMAERGGQPHTTVNKTCVKKEDLDQERFLRNSDPSCTRKTVSRSANKVVIAMTCGGTPPREGSFTFEARTPESVVGVIDQQTDGGNLHVDVAGKWLQASCAGIEPPPTK